MAKKVYAKTPRNAYATHKSHAKQRGIEFKMTFAEWFSVWTESGHWNERGHRHGCYVMARYGDVGPYAVGNVKIELHEINSVESTIGVPRTAEVRAKIGAGHLGKPRSLESRAKQRATQIARWDDPERRAKVRAKTIAQFADPEARRRASERQLAYLARQRQCPT
jgi:hypothetical protein